MTGYGFFKSLRAILFLGVFLLGSWLGAARLGYEELSTEAQFRRTYGADWRAKYEAVHGSLAVAHAKLAAAGVGFVAVCALAVWLSKLLRPDYLSRRSSRKRRRRHQSGSRGERMSVDPHPAWSSPPGGAHGRQTLISKANRTQANPAEPGAAPNDGTTTSSADPEARDGPPLVS